MQEQFMKIALALAGCADPAPNPRVGALVVKDGDILGRGYHRKAGDAHAEVLAIKEAGNGARGADLYVTLEPCCHRGGAKRTPPCTDIIIATDIRRVFTASLDPNPKVHGQGLQTLEEAGIETITGILSDEEEELNREYHHFHKTGLPWVHLKQAISIDGYLTQREGYPTAITGEEGLQAVHDLRRTYQAILVGASTVRIDDPRLTARPLLEGTPVRIILDGREPLTPEFRVFDTTAAPTILVTGHRLPERQKELESQGVEVMNLWKMDLPLILKALGDKGIISILAEGGKKLASAQIKDSLVQEYSLFLSRLRFWSGVTMLDTLAGSLFPETWDLVETHRYGQDTHLLWRKEKGVCSQD